MLRFGCTVVFAAGVVHALPHSVSDEAASAGRRVRAGNASEACTTKPDAKDKDLNSALAYCCSPPPNGGGTNCSAINPGGSHWIPNDSVDHAKFAFNEFYQSKANGPAGYDTCFFGSTAFLTPPPVGHYHFVQGGSMLYPTQAQQGVGLWDTCAPNSSVTYTTPKFSGKYLAPTSPGTGLTLFSIWIAGTSAGAKAHVEIEYELGCLPNRQEIYNSRPMDIVPKYQAYTNAQGMMIQPTGKFCDSNSATATGKLLGCPGPFAC